MAKRSDKLVHLTVTAFAWTMTLLSGAVIIDTDCQPLAHWVNQRFQAVGGYDSHRPTEKAWPLTVEGYADMLAGTSFSQPAHVVSAYEVKSTLHTARTSSSTGIVSTIGGSFGQSGGSPFSTATVHLNVLPAGPDTPTSVVAPVKQMITHYNIVGTVSSDLKMGTNEPVTVYVAQNAADYAEALAKVGLSHQQASALSADTGGFTLGNTMIVALFQNQTPGDLANTIAHELTHVIFNGNIGQLPSWVNEGLAVSQGMYAQARVQGWIGYSGYARQMAQTVIDAARTKTLIPLAVNEATVLQNDHTYDIELQDWLSVQYLLQRFGYESVLAYFQRIKLGEPYDLAFSRTFHMSFSDFNRAFTQALASAANATDSGVNVGLALSSPFHGNVRILQHGGHRWQVFALTAGNTSTINVTSSGVLRGVHVLKQVADVSPVDSGTLYINIKPTSAERMYGKAVTDCGFAVNYSDGLYGYADTWITFASGRTVYNHSPSLFGVDLVRLSEANLKDPVIAWLMTKSNS